MAKSRFKYGLNIWKSWLMGHPRWRLHVQNSRLAEDAAFASRSADVGLQKQTSYWCNIMALRGNVWILNARQLLTARRRGIVGPLPSVTEDEINDRSKGDAFVKAIAAFNVLLLVTQLEIVTLSFLLCSLATYMVLLRKPKDVCTCIYVLAARQPSVDDFKELGYLGPSAFWYVRAETWVPDNSVHYIDVGNIRWLRFLLRYSLLHVSMIATLLTSILFGAVYLIAWNFEFLTQGERLGWHIACVLTLVVLFFIVTTMMYAADVWRKLLRLSLGRAKNVGIGRAFVLVEALRSLTLQLGGAFTATDMGDGGMSARGEHGRRIRPDEYSMLRPGMVMTMISQSDIAIGCREGGRPAPAIGLWRELSWLTEGKAEVEWGSQGCGAGPQVLQSLQVNYTAMIMWARGCFALAEIGSWFDQKY
ncbi:uncharacterized protein BDR25DRAFT_347810 [Lindgomyces ingoldianus]|uniref:Uncharacterized protein n=1 Tax=Lindgomyces ingoldianus TaxID=673940 RepID=A0ACB6RE36_9PLEO|nr:uncharacterized protein BDR25DRAFT_347810 [Lindgomyces ingoldianus]KAF2477451.1 hypothetical protein BDR25DRAFT_347810 [Lindgomyces ingoldianus]